MESILCFIFSISLLMIIVLLGIIIYEVITKKYKFKLKNLIKVILILLIMVIITPYIWVKYGPSEKELCVKSLEKFANNIGQSFEYDRKNNNFNLILKNTEFERLNVTTDEYLNKYLNGDEKIEENIIGQNNLKDNLINICEEMIKERSKFSNVDIDITVKSIEQKSQKDIFIVKNGKLEYNIFENIEKQAKKVKEAKEIEEAKKAEEAKSKAKEQETSVANIPKRASNLYEIKFGQLLDAIENNNVLVIKAKIEPSYNNKATINQNGFNIEDLILNKNADLYDEIQYWAVADMEDGTESKVISFTVDKNLIKSIKNKSTVGNQIIDQAKDVWILPSLSK